MHDYRLVAVAYDHFAAPLPPAINKAADVVEAAQAAVAAAHRETEPPIDVSSASAIAASIDRIAMHRAAGQHRPAVATAVATAAEQTLLQAWESHVPKLHDAMRKWFADAAAEFVDVLGQLGGSIDLADNVRRGLGDLHARAETLASGMAAIRNARSVLHGRLEVEASTFWRWTQTVEPVDHATTLMLDNVVRGHRLGPDPVEGSAAWWALLVTHPGVVALKYRNRHEQRALWEALPSATVASTRMPR